MSVGPFLFLQPLALLGLLALPLLMPAFATHLYRYGAANRWKRFPSMSTAMQLTVLK